MTTDNRDVQIGDYTISRLPDTQKWVIESGASDPLSAHDTFEEAVARVNQYATEGKGRRTAKDIQDLKENWKSDPCWDIEDTPGFEVHSDELQAWREEYELDVRIEELRRQGRKSTELGITMKLLVYIESLERRIAQLEATQVSN